MKKLVVSVPEAAEALGIGQTKCWALTRSGQLRTVRVGSRVLVPIAAVEAFVAGEPEAVAP